MKVISLTKAVEQNICELKLSNIHCQYFSLASFYKKINQDGVVLIVDEKKIHTAFVVDGMGGHQGGELATIKLVECCQKYIKDFKIHDGNIPDQRITILDILESADQEIKDLKLGAGATVTAIEIGKDFVRFYNAGDAFGILIGARGKLKFKTVEHSPLGFGIEAGIIDRDDNKVESHVVSNGLGLLPMRIEISQKLPIKNNDLICLGTDGILNNFKIDDVINAITEGEFEIRMEKLLTNLTQAPETYLNDDTTLLLLRFCY